MIKIKNCLKLTSLYTNLHNTKIWTYKHYTPVPYNNGTIKKIMTLPEIDTFFVINSLFISNLLKIVISPTSLFLNCSLNLKQYICCIQDSKVYIKVCTATIINMNSKLYIGTWIRTNLKPYFFEMEPNICIQFLIYHLQKFPWASLVAIQKRCVCVCVYI